MKIKFVEKSSALDDNLILIVNSKNIPEITKKASEIIGLDIEDIIKNQDIKNIKHKYIYIPTSHKKIKSVIVFSLEDTDVTKVLARGKNLLQILNKHNISSVQLHHPENFDHNVLLDLMLGVSLNSYKFKKYLTKKREDDREVELESIAIPHKSYHQANVELEKHCLIVESINLTKDLILEPANVLYPESFAKICKDLKKYGLAVDVLDTKEMQKLEMNALLGVAQGSSRPAQLVVMRWNGAEKHSQKPLAFVGKGVTFDSGGLSLKTATGMEAMKYDMGGAAVVTGLLMTLAMRKAKVNAVGVIGLVENMPDGNAQKPGDIVKTMSGQTIEVLNTDAEGRLVLSDALWYTQDKYKPELMIDLATLTGAIVVALGDQYAGLFSNNDKLAENLTKAGLATGEKLWRMPLDSGYDKMIDSQIADMKNITGGSGAGSITAAQLLQRFVNNVPWAHIDIAGVTDIMKAKGLSMGGPTAFGVRLLNKFIMDNYEG